MCLQGLYIVTAVTTSGDGVLLKIHQVLICGF